MKPGHLAFAAILAASNAQAQGVEVDLELALMVDVSRSMSYDELDIQRRGYAAALRSDELWSAVRSGRLGRVAITYVEWAGSQRVVVPWQLVETRDDLNAIADALSFGLNPTMRRTSISEALAFATASFESNGFESWRRVIDISGDGPNNQGRTVESMRDAAVAEGIVINGLPLMTEDGFGSQWNIDDLDVYYRECVVGGPGAFVIPVLGWEEFADAVLQKLVAEVMIGALPPAEYLVPAQLAVESGYDCLIGEKIWMNRSRDWNEP